MRRDYVILGAIWLLLTVLGEVFAALVDFYPIVRSDKGEDIELAFRVLVHVGIPVLTFVVAVIVYSVARHHSAGEAPDIDGPPMQGKGRAPLAWFAITTALALAVLIYPGLIGIPQVFDDDPPDLIVEVQGLQWTWFVSYPEYEISNARELVLPVDRTVKFEITSLDVLHSFWVPSFLMKIDAVPGRTTTISLTPTVEGTFQSDPNLRVQCAELCGISHATMRINVSIVSDAEFAAWVEQMQASGPSGEPIVDPDAQQIRITSSNTRFDLTTISVEADRQVEIVFDNQDDGVPHNWAFYESESDALAGVPAIAGSPVELGLLIQTVVFDPPAPGSYFFRCDVHPSTMTGTLEVQ